MAKFTKQTFQDQTITLDGNEYEFCHFDRCKLHFTATAPVKMNGCSFMQCRPTLGGAAELTFHFFGALYSVEGFRPFMEASFENIRCSAQQN